MAMHPEGLPGARAATSGNPRPRGRASRPRPPARGGHWHGLDGAAATAVAQLAHQVPLDLWLVTRAQEGSRVVVAVAGSRWGESGVSPGALVRFSTRGAAGRMPASTSGPLARSLGGVVHLPQPTVEIRLVRQDASTAGWLHGVGRPGPGTTARSVEGWAGLAAEMLAAVLMAEGSVREQELVASRALDLAVRDQLTGLHNRRGWMAGLQRSASARAGDDPVAVLVADVDDLKHVNDTQGHAAGDAVLSRCAAVLARTCRDDDLVVRTGGDEFAVLARGAAAPAGDLERRISAALVGAGVAASLGSAQRRPGEDLMATWKRADASMLADKRWRRSGGFGPATSGIVKDTVLDP